MTLAALETGDLGLVLPVCLIERPKAVLHAAAELGPRHNEGDGLIAAGEFEPHPAAIKFNAGRLIDVENPVCGHVSNSPSGSFDTPVNSVNGGRKIIKVNERLGSLVSKAA